MHLETLKFLVNSLISLVDVRIVQFLTIGLVFVPLERLIPFHPRQRLFRSLIRLDLIHYFVGGLFIIVMIRFTSDLMAPITAAFVAKSPIASFPWYGKLAVWELGWTGTGYWMHRLAHTWRPLWRMHVVHESSKELDWLSAFRLHPLEPFLFHLFTIVPLFLLGVSYPVVVGYSLFTYVFTHVQHANVVFPIGPIKYVFPTPEFHRWHHARVRDLGGNDVVNLCNFGQYPFWDLMFGTLYLPDEKPVEYGSADGDTVPLDFLGQLAFPFGCHEQVLAVERWIARPFRAFGDRVQRVGTALTPIHTTIENQLARLCLLRVPAPNIEGEKT